MRFDTLGFVLVFLPLVVALFHLAGRQGYRWALTFLAGASLVFYGWWDVRYVPLILTSVLVNFVLGRLIAFRREADPGSGLLILAIGVTFNLGLIAYFKYAGFLVLTANGLVGLGWAVPSIILPLAISFFTFQQIAFLADVRAGKVERFNLLEYAVFVLFFPQLIAGPIVHFREVLPQFRTQARLRSPQLARVSRNLAVGLGIFAIGLFKKVVFADTMGSYADPLFEASANGVELTFFEAWGATLCFTFQIYFDFSGYSDMAIGLARMFGIRLPLNFAAPYKATNIVDFWRRWHITLSRFLRDYLYVPLGGNRKGRSRRYANLMITMFLGGLWHGAAWTFVVWGGLHGLYLVLCHGWRFAKSKIGWPRGDSSRLGRGIACLTTFVAVAAGWTLFRAESFESAGHMLRSMGGLNGIAIPEDLRSGFGSAAAQLESLGIGFAPSPLWAGAEQWIWILVLLFVVWFCPTTQEIFAGFRPALGFVRPRLAQAFGRLSLAQGQSWQSLLSWSLLAALALSLALASVPPLQSEGQGLAIRLLAVIVICFVVAVLSFEPYFRWRPSVAQFGIWSLIMTMNLLMLYRGKGEEFIYFQF